MCYYGKLFAFFNAPVFDIKVSINYLIILIKSDHISSKRISLAQKRVTNWLYHVFSTVIAYLFIFKLYVDINFNTFKTIKLFVLKHVD